MDASTELGSKTLEFATIDDGLNWEPEVEISRRQPEVISQTKNILYPYIFMAVRTNYLLYHNA